MKNSYDKRLGENYVAIALIIIVAIPLWLPVMVFAIDKFYFTPTRNIENSWDFDIPSDFKQVYHTSSDSIYARGDGYTVYETSGDVSGFIDKFYYANEPVVENYIKGIIANLSVPKNYRPPFDDAYCYLHKSYGEYKLFVVYFPSTNLCFFYRIFQLGQVSICISIKLLAKV